MMNIAIIGASPDRERMANKAVRAYVQEGHNVFPVNPKETEVEGLRCYENIKEIAGQSIMGFNRADFADDDDAGETTGDLFRKNTTGGVASGIECINQSSALFITDDI